MIVEIWSDISCPWCYIGRRRFEEALQQFPQREQVEVVWRSFELDPYAPRESAGTVEEMLMRKYRISLEEAAAMHARAAAFGAQEGLELRFERVQPVNTRDAHRLIHLAAAHRLQGEMKERLQRAYFTEGLCVSDPDTLVKLAGETGLDEAEARRTLESGAYEEAVRADQQKAQRLGIRGVPFFLFEGKYALSGAQPAEVFASALEHVWTELHPQADLTAGD